MQVRRRSDVRASLSCKRQTPAERKGGETKAEERENEERRRRIRHQREEAGDAARSGRTRQEANGTVRKRTSSGRRFPSCTSAECFSFDLPDPKCYFAVSLLIASQVAQGSPHSQYIRVIDAASVDGGVKSSFTSRIYASSGGDLWDGLKPSVSLHRSVCQSALENPTVSEAGSRRMSMRHTVRFLFITQ